MTEYLQVEILLFALIIVLLSPQTMMETRGESSPSASTSHPPPRPTSSSPTAPFSSRNPTPLFYTTSTLPPFIITDSIAATFSSISASSTAAAPFHYRHPTIPTTTNEESREEEEIISQYQNYMKSSKLYSNLTSSSSSAAVSAAAAADNVSPLSWFPISSSSSSSSSAAKTIGGGLPSTKPPSSSSLLLVNPTAALLVHLAHDSHANLRHHHHNSHSWGPHFEETGTINVTVTEGDNVKLDCRVGLIEDKMVSWVRRKSDQLDLLTLGTSNYSSDPRISSDFKYPNNWRLAIRNSSRSDSGIYLCQISTHPPKSLEVHLTVQAPQVFIVNSRGERISEVHYKEGSTLQLICSVNNILSKSLNWFRNNDLLNHDVSRGGVSIKTDLTTEHAKSILRVALVTRKDGGTYLCSAPPQNASVTVHVLNGENPAELYRNGAPPSARGHLQIIWSWNNSYKNCAIIFVLLLSSWTVVGSCVLNFR